MSLPKPKVQAPTPAPAPAAMGADSLKLGGIGGEAVSSAVQGAVGRLKLRAKK